MEDQRVLTEGDDLLGRNLQTAIPQRGRELRPRPASGRTRLTDQRIQTVISITPAELSAEGGG